MNRLIFTRINNSIVSFLFDGNQAVSIGISEPQNHILGNVYVGNVSNIVKNIDAAFVYIGEGEPGYLSLKDNPSPVFLNNKNNDRICMNDMIVVQVLSEQIKAKRPMLTTKIEISGQYSVVIYGKKGINVSAKIDDEGRRREILSVIEKYKSNEYAIIARTNAQNAENEQICADVEECVGKIIKIFESARHLKSGACIYESEPDYLQELKNTYISQVDEIITDDEEIYDKINEYINKSATGLSGKLRLYQDEYPLFNMYNLRKVLDNAMRKNVWLKSGGFIVIEPTEALTAIDVNTGKAIAGKKKSLQTFFNINMEAADEIARQIRLRNLSGIIIIDFINLPDKSLRNELIEHFRELLKKDPVKAVVVDMTALNLLEVTRKKIKSPLHEKNLFLNYKKMLDDTI